MKKGRSAKINGKLKFIVSRSDAISVLRNYMSYCTYMIVRPREGCVNLKENLVKEKKQKS